MTPARSWERESEGRLRLGLIFVIVACMLVLGREKLLAPFDRWTSDPDGAPRAVTPRGNLAEDEKATVEIFENVSPSVVFVTTLGIRRGLFFEPMQVPEGTGTGFMWDAEGHIVTNYHVIASVRESGGSCWVTLKDHSTWEAKIRGVAPDQDLAVLTIDAPKNRLRKIPIGTSGDLQVGQKVFAIGNPVGFGQTLSAGIVAALHREMTARSGRKIQDVIQTDAAINPGNSGGPLLDSAGRLIGITSAIDAEAQNIGFAVPVDTVNRVVPELIEHGGRPGLRSLYLSARQAAVWFGIRNGVVVRQVFPGSAAAKAGIRGIEITPSGQYVINDVILRIDGHSVKTRNDILDRFEEHKVGDDVELEVSRDGQLRKIIVKLQPLE